MTVREVTSQLIDEFVGLLTNMHSLMLWNIENPTKYFESSGYLTILYTIRQL